MGSPSLESSEVVHRTNFVGSFQMRNVESDELKPKTDGAPAFVIATGHPLRASTFFYSLCIEIERFSSSFFLFFFN